MDPDHEQELYKSKRREQYRTYRQKLIDLGILPNRGPGRPRLRPPAEALAVAREQKLASKRRTQEHIRNELARLAAEASSCAPAEV